MGSSDAHVAARIVLAKPIADGAELVQVTSVACSEQSASSVIRITLMVAVPYHVDGCPVDADTVGKLLSDERRLARRCARGHVVRHVSEDLRTPAGTRVVMRRSSTFPDTKSLQAQHVTIACVHIARMLASDRTPAVHFSRRWSRT